MSTLRIKDLSENKRELNDDEFYLSYQVCDSGNNSFRDRKLSSFSHVIVDLYCIVYWQAKTGYTLIAKK